MTARTGPPGEGRVHEIQTAGLLEWLVSERHSCRGFLADAVPKAAMMQVLEIAQRTPSWGNVQPWRVLVTSGAGTERFRQALVEKAECETSQPDLPFPREYSEIYKERRRAAALRLFTSVGASTRSKSLRQTAENFRFYGAPHIAIVTTDQDLGVYGAIDCGAYIANFMLAAKSLGIATIAQASIAMYSPFIRNYFRIPESRLIVCGIAFGFEDPQHPANGFRTDRAAIDDVVMWIEE